MLVFNVTLLTVSALADMHQRLKPKDHRFYRVFTRDFQKRGSIENNSGDRGWGKNASLRQAFQNQKSDPG
jgi:hypothetical protein